MLNPADVLSELQAWRVAPADPNATYTLDDYRALVRERGEGALFKGACREHLTASLFVLNRELTHILLALHKKAGMWLQFGGHLERTDASLTAAGWREGLEESGLAGYSDFLERPSDIDIHQLGDGFAGVCSEHWDVGFVAIADSASEVAVSAESAEIGWFPIADLPGGSAGNMYPRVAAAVARARDYSYPHTN